VHIRDIHLRANPLCVMCLPKGIVRTATEVDHIVPICKGGADTLDPFENRQGLCSECHEDKTRIDLGQQQKTRIGPDGWPSDE
jgi:5-methylcytosine-specific restriction protein A